MDNKQSTPAAEAISIRHSPYLAEAAEMLQGCMQCGTCSGSCPNIASMDLTPREVWRLAMFGREEEIFGSMTMFYCSSCYNCTLRCPKGLPLTEAMAALKRAARDYRGARVKEGLFYRSFANNLLKYGRIQEGPLMFDYFLSRRDPMLPLAFTGLGLKLLRKGKLHLPSSAHAGVLRPLLDKVREVERGQERPQEAES